MVTIYDQCRSNLVFEIRNNVVFGILHVIFYVLFLTQKASALDFKDTATLRFSHSDDVSDLFIEHTIFAFNHTLI